MLTYADACVYCMMSAVSQIHSGCHAVIINPTHMHAAMPHWRHRLQHAWQVSPQQLVVAIAAVNSHGLLSGALRLHAPCIVVYAVDAAFRICQASGITLRQSEEFDALRLLLLPAAVGKTRGAVDLRSACQTVIQDGSVK